MIEFKSSGSFKNTEDFLGRITHGDIYRRLEKYAQEGVRALERATPQDSGETAHSWSYNIVRGRNSYSIVWTNDHMTERGDTPIAVLIQHGHGTGTGGYVQGRDFINPALRPVFDRIAAEVWKEVIGP